MSDVRRGLAGVVADTTAVSQQDAEASSLTYRGYPVERLAATCTFEEVAFLLLEGELPGPGRLAAFRDAERAARALGPAEAAVAGALDPRAHPLDAIRTVLSAGGAGDADAGDGDAAPALVARTPTALAHHLRRRAGADPIAPDPARGLAENLLWMCTGAEPDPEVAGALEASLVLYAELGFNASTFTARAVTSTGADMRAAAVAALSALRGPLHGGANERVWAAMRSAGGPAGAAALVRSELEAGRRVTGFGHRVFRTRDPRARPMRDALERLAGRTADGPRVLAMHDAMVAEMAAGKGIPPNVDLAAGPAYHLMGFPEDAFTALFAVGRMAGWCAHAREARAAGGPIIHPLAAYAGPPQREVPR